MNRRKCFSFIIIVSFLLLSYLLSTVWLARAARAAGSGLSVGVTHLLIGQSTLNPFKTIGSDEAPIPFSVPYFHAPMSPLATTVSGNISGTWTAAGNPYIVTGDLVITAGDALTIQPGVEVRFAGSYRLTVYGDLMANGTTAAPITFTSHLSSPQPGDWGGIQFYNSGDNDRLSHVQVEFAQTGIDIDAVDGTASPTLEHSVITHNSDDGISISANAGTDDTFARPEILSSTIAFNSDDGIYVYGKGGSGEDDDGYAQPTIRNNIIVSNNGTGIYLYGRGGSETSTGGYAAGDIISNTIASNGSYGIHCYGHGGSYGCMPIACIVGSASPDIIGNVIADNGSTGIYMRADGDFWAGYSNTGNTLPLVTNNIVVNNNGDGLKADASDPRDKALPKIVNNTVISNALSGIQSTEEVYSSFAIYNNLLISNATGLSAYEGEVPDVRCNGLWGNAADFVNYPPEYGDVITINLNGDPSDIYYNIFLDPRFVDASTRDYHLRRDSPAIDAGCDESFVPDSDIDGESRPREARYDIGADECWILSTYLPIILKPDVTTLFIKSINTGGAKVYVLDLSDAQYLECTVPDNTTWLCGSFPSIGSYKMVAETANCGTLGPFTFHDATGGTITRTVFCN